jgi:hypothetical protein
MKTIFIFNDSRPTDVLHPVVALGEDGHVVVRIKFDSFTLPYCQFVMGTSHFIHCDDADISEPVVASRANVLRRYTEIYGAGNWIPLWLDAPRSNPDWSAAMRIHHARGRHALIGDGAAAINSTTSRLLGSIFDTAATLPHTTH